MQDDLPLDTETKYYKDHHRATEEEEEAEASEDSRLLQKRMISTIHRFYHITSLSCLCPV